MGTKYCTSCGAALNSGVKFCTNCGQNVLLKPITRDNTQVEYHDNKSDTIDDYNESNSLKNILLGFYVLLNIPLYSMSGGDDQMLGFLFYSLVITIVIALRIKKDNTFNWVLKILIGLQLLFVLSIFISQIDFLFIDLYSSIATILFFLLSIVLITMLVKGNSK